MDIREKKTKRSISNAFLEIRSQKPLEVAAHEAFDHGSALIRSEAGD